MVMSIVDDVEKLSTLRQESSDLPIVPTTDDRFTVIHKFDTEAFKSRHFDSQKLLSGRGVPNSNVVSRTSGKHLRVLARESDVIYSFVVTSVSKLRVDGVRVRPVDSGSISSNESVSSVSS